MALFKSQVITQASGSVGGMTYSRNKGGMYIRARAIPTNPNTPAQQAARSALTTITQRWTAILSAAQRAAWAVYAENVPMPGKLGDPILLSGQQHYIRSNSIRVRVDPTGVILPVVDDAPTTFNTGNQGAPQLASLTPPAAFTYSWIDPAGWEAEDDGALLVFISRPQDPTITFFKGPYQFTDATPGSLGAPPTTPSTGASTFPFIAGNRVFIYTRVSRADGRLTGPAFSFLDA